MKCFALLLLSVCCASAQLSLQQMQPFFHGTPSSSSDPIGVPGLAEWWRFTDLVTNNMPITNWFGRVQNTIATNGAATLQPTNSANGVMFGQNLALQYLTNLPIDLGSNFTVIVRAKATREGFAPASVYPMWGQFGTAWEVGWGDGTSPKATFAWNDHSSVNHGSSPLSGIIGTYIDHMMVCSNNANGTGKIYGYTNAVSLGLNIAAEPNHTFFRSMAWAGSAVYATTDRYEGLVEDYLIYTNVLTPAQLLTVYQYHTNTWGP